MLKKSLFAMALTALVMAGCDKKNTESEPVTDVSSEPASTDASVDADMSKQTDEPAFDISAVPPSTVPLGDFPYITLPPGYISNGKPETKRIARFPFWVKGKAHWVEGQFYLVNVHPEEEGDYNPYELGKNLDAMVQQMGGVEVSEERIPYETIENWGDEITMGFLTGLGDVYNVPVRTYLVRRDDGNIWIHFAQSTAQGGIIVGKEKAFVATARLLPASELKKEIDTSGKVALQVNFATDKTDILPDSQPQIAQVVQLLNDDPSLKLAVNGHTDNTGDSAHNQTLSEGRAKSVVAALTAQGIAATRLTAAGFGDTQPVADNDSADGKARNRRVELVKQP